MSAHLRGRAGNVGKAEVPGTSYPGRQGVCGGEPAGGLRREGVAEGGDQGTPEDDASVCVCVRGGL